MQGMVVYQWVGIITALLLGVGGLIRGIQMKNGRLDLISDWDNRPLPNPTEHALAFSRVYVRLGSAFLISPIVFGIGLHILVWAIIASALVWYWFEAIERISSKARSESAIL